MHARNFAHLVSTVNLKVFDFIVNSFKTTEDHIPFSTIVGQTDILVFPGMYASSEIRPSGGVTRIGSDGS